MKIERWVEVVMPEKCASCGSLPKDRYSIRYTEKHLEGDSVTTPVPQVVDSLSKRTAQLLYAKAILDGMLPKRVTE